MGQARNCSSALKHMLLQLFHPDSDCDGSSLWMPIPRACSPALPGPVVAPPPLLLPLPHRDHIDFHTSMNLKYWHLAKPPPHAIKFQAQMQVTPAKAVHYRNTTRPPSRSVSPFPSGFYLQTAHKYACSHSEPTACLLELVCLWNLTCPWTWTDSDKKESAKAKTNLNNQDFAYSLNDVPATFKMIVYWSPVSDIEKSTELSKIRTTVHSGRLSMSCYT
jgi:hypothetical protein